MLVRRRPRGASVEDRTLLLWSDHFLERGIAVITLDWPGTGEASHVLLTADCDDVTDGIDRVDMRGRPDGQATNTTLAT